jgi:hypothetical protein
MKNARVDPLVECEEQKSARLIKSNEDPETFASLAPKSSMYAEVPDSPPSRAKSLFFFWQMTTETF